VCAIVLSAFLHGAKCVRFNLITTARLYFIYTEGGGAGGDGGLNVVMLVLCVLMAYI
jgi:hypothetical protein